MRFANIGLILVLATTVACGRGDDLRLLAQPGEGPDEFRIVPGQPLQPPESYSELPAPTPGGANLTDQNPLQDSVAALGGNRGSATGTIPGTDGSVVNYASRFGRDGGIRQTLATEDEAFRKRRSRFTRLSLVPRDVYAVVYRSETLNARAEASRWRRAGARTPSSDP